MPLCTRYPSKVVRELPALEENRVRAACEALAKGRLSYRALLYLNRAQPRDVPALFAAGSGDDIDLRWANLWVVCGPLARVARRTAGITAIAAAIQADMATMQFFSAFIKHGHLSAQRLFERARMELLILLLKQIVEPRADSRWIPTISGMIAQVESRQLPLQAALERNIEAQRVSEVMTWLHIEEPEPERPAMTTRKMGEKMRRRLQALEPPASKA